jgi:hypothetical protein
MGTDFARAKDALQLPKMPRVSRRSMCLGLSRLEGQDRLVFIPNGALEEVKNTTKMEVVRVTAGSQRFRLKLILATLVVLGSIFR